MSLSQKHAGKVLVPWFNIAEWKAVYKLIYDESSQNWAKALEILHIWKLRTPLLSAGVEGTLILLEALLADQNKLTSYEITHIFATSLIRFLNLCAANSDKQGTFYKTAKENELPNWLISLRHDIAHSHNVPSQSMLKLSLKWCLDWLKGKYWEIQHEYMTEFIVNDAEAEDFYRYLSAYIQLLKPKESLDDKNKKQNNRTENVDDVAKKFKEMIRKKPEETLNKIFLHLINKNAFLTVDCGSDSSEKKKIPNSCLRVWNELINIIYESEEMLKFINILFNFICDETQNTSQREVGSLWIKEVFQGLINKETNSEDNNTLHFNNKNNSMKDKTFAIEAVRRRTSFTLNFVKEVLEYNNAPPQFIEDSVSLISAFNAIESTEKQKIFTVNDLNPGSEETVESETVVEKETESNSRWLLMENTAHFRNLPLGILPHQPRTVNPVLDI